MFTYWAGSCQNLRQNNPWNPAMTVIQTGYDQLLKAVTRWQGTQLQQAKHKGIEEFIQYSAIKFDF